MSKLCPKHYDENSLFQKTVAMEVMSLFPANHKDVILDIGCGDGYLTSLLAKTASSGLVKGIDPSTDMIEHARKTYNGSDNKNLSFSIGSAESVNSDNLYSLITAFNCLHWSHNLEAAFKRCHQALKKGGRFVGVTYPSESIYWQIFTKTLSQPKWETLLSISPVSAWFSSDGYQKLALENNFEILFFNPEECMASYDNQQTLKDYINGWLSCFIPISKKEQTRFLADVLDYAEEHFKTNNVINIPYTKLTYCLVKKHN